MSIEKIVADYEICKKAWDIGLRIESNVHWLINERTFTLKPVKIIDSNGDITYFCFATGRTTIAVYDDVFVPAPTCEEVPLPSNLSFAHWWVMCGHYRQIRISDIDVSIYESSRPDAEMLIGFRIFNQPINEATARLKMAIWLVENVPEAKSWYASNSYLK